MSVSGHRARSRRGGRRSDAHAPRHAPRGTRFRSFSPARPRLRSILTVTPCARAPGRTGANIEFRSHTPVTALIASPGNSSAAGALRGHSWNAEKCRRGPGHRRLGASVANAWLPRSDRVVEAGGDRDRHRSGLCDGRLRDARRRSDGLARRAAPANAAGQPPLGARYAHGGITMERFALRKPSRSGPRRHQRVHGLRQVVTHADDLQCDP